MRAACAQHLIFRVSWVYGTRGKNFLRTMLRLAQERDELRVVSDQVGVPTWSRAIADATAQVIARNPQPSQAGTYHLAGSGRCSWHAFADAIVQHARQHEERFGVVRARQVHAISSAEYPTPAARPAYSVLDASRLSHTFNVTLPTSAAQLDACLATLGG